MRRRQFIAGLEAAVCLGVARAQQPTIPVIGFLKSATARRRSRYRRWSLVIPAAGLSPQRSASPPLITVGPLPSGA
jgi:hypothetical protein